MENFTIKDLSETNSDEIEVSDHRDAMEICTTLNAANPGTLWVIQQNV